MTAYNLLLAVRALKTVPKVPFPITIALTNSPIASRELLLWKKDREWWSDFIEKEKEGIRKETAKNENLKRTFPWTIFVFFFYEMFGSMMFANEKIQNFHHFKFFLHIDESYSMIILIKTLYRVFIEYYLMI